MTQTEDQPAKEEDNRPVGSSPPGPARSNNWRLGWSLLLLIHAAGCLAWWWVMPHGFPLDHPRCWANTILPWGGFGLLLSGVWAAWRGNTQWFLAITLSVPLAWTTAILVAFVLFPMSVLQFLFSTLIVSVLLWIAWIAAQRGRAKSLLQTGCTSLLVISGTGVFIYSQRAPAADTHPLNVAFPEVPAGVDNITRSGVANVNEHASMYFSDGTLRVQCEPLTLMIAPLLTFESRSPDRCWTSLAPPQLSEGVTIVPDTIWQQGETWNMLLRGNETLALIVSPAEETQTLLSATAFARLELPVYSHLNSFLQLDVSGHQKLQVSFSPCADQVIDVLPADYPVGRPARFAYLNAAGMFQVVEATSGEKGPFHLLAEGPMDRKDALTITFHDQGQPICDLILDDWAAQLSTQLSPTAGWGVPAGAIEFQRLGEQNTSPAGIWITLAATSVGRGWDSVGHQSGVYRNRFRVIDRREAEK